MRLLLAGVLLFSVGIVRSEEAAEKEGEPSDSEVLTEANFDKFIVDNELVLVKFYAPWCGHCKKMAPDFERAAKQLKETTNIRLGKVDATEHKSLGQTYGVEGYPTLMIFRNGKRTPYKGPRDAAGIVNFMNKLSAPAAQKLDTLKDVEKFMNKMDTTVIGFFNKETEASIFVETAEKLRDIFQLAYTTNADLFKKYDAKNGDIIIFYPSVFQSKFEPKSRTFNKPESTVEEIVTFIKDHSSPLVGKLTKQNHATRYTKLPLVVVYYNADFSTQYREGSEFWRQKVLAVANKYQKDNYNFAVADEDEFVQELGQVGLGDSGLEHNVVAFGYDGKKYPMLSQDFDDEFDQNLENFMKKLSQGNVKPYVKTQPIPKNDKGDVKTLVGANFNKVIDGTKDALIEFYAPWCGHCKTFEPKYAELAKSLKSSEPNLVLAKMDATANDPPADFEVKGFPTIYFLPAGEKNPVPYSGNRDLTDLKKFMAKHAKKSFKKEEL
ncbi:unnamed protein product, partial [Mesorhabditis belari]|uniref:Protein disulfide-isomerase n=1 Tax=Mesorhabditis belari TaxID=2138241 RepID=A0AAF3EAA9_9BILA